MYERPGYYFSVDPWTKWWDQFVHRSASFDVYHTSSYHRVAQECDNVAPRLFVYIHENSFVALPLLFMGNELKSGKNNTQFLDVASVYGYPGPISSEHPVPDRLRRNFCDALEEFLLEMKVATVSSRLHPLLPGPNILRGLGQINLKGMTVSINLRASEEVQYSQYRNNHKRNLARLTQRGYVTMLDEGFRYLKEFSELYTEHMIRVGADDRYFFGEQYFSKLREELGNQMCLFVCRYGGQIASAALFFVCNKYAQYHLGAVAKSDVEYSPLKQVIDVARREFATRNYSVLHLGGGLGANKDSLFHFKAGFSKCPSGKKLIRWNHL